jgi:hypothetical protein
MRRVTQILLEFATHVLARSVFLILSAFEMLVIIAGASERRHRDDSTRPTLRRELKITRSLNKITVVLFRRRTRRFSTPPPPPSSVSAVKRVVSIQRTRDEIESDARRFLQRGFYVAVFYVGNFAPGEVRVA